MKKRTFSIVIVVLLMSISFILPVDADDSLSFSNCIDIISEMSEKYDVTMFIEDDSYDIFYDAYKDFTVSEFRDAMERTAISIKEAPSVIYVNCPDDIKAEILSDRNYKEDYTVFINLEVDEIISDIRRYVEDEAIENDFYDEIQAANGYYTWITQIYNRGIIFDGPYDSYATNPGRDYIWDAYLESQIFVYGNERQYTGLSSQWLEIFRNQRYLKAYDFDSVIYNSYKTTAQYKAYCNYISTVGLNMGSVSVISYFSL